MSAAPSEPATVGAALVGAAHRRARQRGARSRLDWALDWALGLALGLALGCGDEREPTVARHEQIEAVRDNLAAQGVGVTEIVCDGPRVAAGRPAVCEAALGAVGGTPARVRMEVSLAASGDALDVRPLDPVVVVAQVVPEVEANVRAAGIDVAEVRCPDEVWIASAGATAQCLLIDRAGRTLHYHAEFSGRGAEHTMTVRPSEGPAPSPGHGAP